MVSQNCFFSQKEKIFQHFPFPVRSIRVITKTGSGRRFLLPNRLRAWYDESSNFNAALRRQEEGFLMDECLLEKFYQTWYHELIRWCSHMAGDRELAEDLVQEANVISHNGDV